MLAVSGDTVRLFLHVVVAIAGVTAFLRARAHRRLGGRLRRADRA